MKNYIICVEADSLLAAQGAANGQIHIQLNRGLKPISNTYHYVSETKRHVITIMFSDDS